MCAGHSAYRAGVSQASFARLTGVSPATSTIGRVDVPLCPNGPPCSRSRSGTSHQRH
jgi:hypothetical protein